MTDYNNKNPIYTAPNSNREFQCQLLWFLVFWSHITDCTRIGHETSQSKEKHGFQLQTNLISLQDITKAHKWYAKKWGNYIYTNTGYHAGEPCKNLVRTLEGSWANEQLHCTHTGCVQQCTTRRDLNYTVINKQQFYPVLLWLFQ